MSVVELIQESNSMSWLGKILPNAGKNTEERKMSVPEGIWKKCPKCDGVLYQAELERNAHVCPKCDHHLRIGARQRIDMVFRPRRPRRNRYGLCYLKIVLILKTANVMLTV